MSRIKVPPVDEFARKRKAEHSEVIDALTMVAQNSSDMCKHFINKDDAIEKHKIVDVSVMDPKLVMLKYALDLVPAEYHTTFMIETMQNAQNYSKK